MGKNFLKRLLDPSEDSEFWFEDYPIMHHLRRIKKEHLLFNYDNLESYEDLKLFCTYLLSQSVLGIGTSKQHLPKIRFTTPYEKETSLKAIKDKITNLKVDDVSYNISDLGFRLENPLDFIGRGVGMFGCSITYGIGVPEDKTFSAQLQQKIGPPVYNFGIPGAGIQKITKAFIALNNHYKLKAAVFIMPSMHRFEYMGLEAFDEIFSESYVPNFEPINPNRKHVYDLTYTHYDDIHFLDQFVKHIALIKANAKVNGTRVYFLTWDSRLRDLAGDYKIQDLTSYKIVHFPEIQEKVNGVTVKDFARDGLHPGVRSHTQIANYLHSAIFTEDELNRIFKIEEPVKEEIKEEPQPTPKPKRNLI